jgi:methylmalonyl-CoA mutase C-terminal domain/subunit
MTASPPRKIRVVVAKPGLDGHDRGAKIIARALRDAGMSILSGAHMTLVPRILELMAAQGVDDVIVTVGGTIPPDDVAELKHLGVAEVFTPGAAAQDAIEFIRSSVRA